MYAKIISLGVVASLYVAEAGHRWLVRDTFTDTTPRMVLVPKAVGDWRQTTQWLYPSGLVQFQEYAQYEYQDLLVTMSFDHHRTNPHNAVNCFLGRGERLESSVVRSLKTHDGSARFNIAHFANDGALNVVAVSQCLAQGCIENPPPPAWADLLHLSYWKESLFAPRYSAIPVSITIGSSTAQAQQPSYSAMEQTLVGFIANLDMNPVRRQAQIEAGVKSGMINSSAIVEQQ